MFTFEEYQETARKTAIYPGQTFPLGLSYVALKLNGEAGEFAEHIGKAIRDEGYGSEFENLSDTKRELLIKELGDVLWYLSAACDELETDLEEVARKNNEKLLKRLAENKIQGSGDNR